MVNAKPEDILIFFSDQHNATVAGFAGDPIVRTPNMDALVEEGTVFDAAYTPCPLCVPARMSFLTGQLPSKTGVFTNNGILNSELSTYLHSLASVGYETVLCGRMHFIGDDQRHGFTKRIFGDFTPIYLGQSGKNRTDLGDFAGTTAERYCTKLFGKGDSPVLAYDRAVVKRAVEYLESDYAKPQVIVVGIYGPHFPYVAPEELFDYYRPLITLPRTHEKKANYELKEIGHRKNPISDDSLLDIRAAYYGMVEHVDTLLGTVRKAWKAYLSRNGRQDKFIYLSDHGDQIGERQMYGKKTFFEGSSRIPMIWSGKGILRNNRISEPVNLMDIGPTLCDFTGATLPPSQDGRSLNTLLCESEYQVEERSTLSEYIEEKGDALVPGRMLRKGSWKLISYSYSNEPLLFNLKDDPHELVNLSEQHPKRVEEMQEQLNLNWDVAGIIATYKQCAKHHVLLKQWGSSLEPVNEGERWKIPEARMQKSVGTKLIQGEDEHA